MQLPQGVKVCAVTKNRSLEEIEAVLSSHPEIKIIAENRWPDCVAAFEKFTDYQRHFIGPLQSNKISKVLPLVDCIQSVESYEKMKKIDQAAQALGRPVDFMFQVNISHDASKQGMSESELWDAIERYLATPPAYARLVGLMTIGARVDLEERRQYFRRMKEVFEKAKGKSQKSQVNILHSSLCTLHSKTSRFSPLSFDLSMGMSEDYEIAIEEGTTMIRLGSALFE